TEKPVEGKKPAKPKPVSPAPEGRDDKPIVRQRSGIGSYEDPADERRQKRRPGKTGRPGQ
ncbi:hypothetical protein, partial [Mesorhizobium sp. M2C.T.Ca.TU.002.02.1.1]|uniref:hypothetical protein n=1 Tax=Mesorhizobium sp. M2C.T.Ca.TU.002.02.1.1 TaxID=2496788 RepID=UPI000FD4551E